MLSEAKSFWEAIKGQVSKLCKQETANALRAERYDVTTVPNGTTIGVTQPYGTNEIFIPYAAEVAEAKVGDTVLVIWWGSMSNAKAWFFGSGPTKEPIDTTTRLTFTNVSVASSSFVSDSTYSDFPYRAAVALDGVTAEMFPDVAFSVTNAMSGVFAPVAATYNGGVYIYASAKTAVTIPTITCLI